MTGRILPFPKTELIKEVEDGYFYIDLSLITRKELKENLPILLNSKGLIADSRYRTGGVFQYFLSLITDTAINTGYWNSPVFRYPNRENIRYIKENPWTIYPDKEYHIKAPVVFLSGHNCLSRCETNLEFVKHYKLGKIIGEPTQGVNGDTNFAYIGKKSLNERFKIKTLLKK